MIIYTLMVDPERGKYLAIAPLTPPECAISFVSQLDAVGRLFEALTKQTDGVIIHGVVEVVIPEG